MTIDQQIAVLYRDDVMEQNWSKIVNQLKQRQCCVTRETMAGKQGNWRNTGNDKSGFCGHVCNEVYYKVKVNVTRACNPGIWAKPLISDRLRQIKNRVSENIALSGN